MLSDRVAKCRLGNHGIMRPVMSEYSGVPSCLTRSLGEDSMNDYSWRPPRTPYLV